MLYWSLIDFLKKKEHDEITEPSINPIIITFYTNFFYF